MTEIDCGANVVYVSAEAHFIDAEICFVYEESDLEA